MDSEERLSQNGSCVLEYSRKWGGPAKCSIHWQHNDGYTLVEVRGFVTFSIFDQFETALSNVQADAEDRLLIDLSNTRAMDSSGIGCLVQLAATNSDKIVLINPSPSVARLLGVTHLDLFFDVCGSVEEAEAKFGLKDRSGAVSSTANTPG